MWFRISIVAAFLTLAAIAGVWWWGLNLDSTEDAQVQGEIVQTASTAAPHSVRAIIVDQSDEDRRLLECNDTSCKEIERPTEATANAVFDGTSWYYYTEQENEKSDITKKFLKRTFVAGETSQLMESTPLTAPRGLLISPSGEAVAFFLDNIDQPNEELTELWVYDALQKQSHVVAEKLYVPDIRSEVRWNRVSSLLWFVADTGDQEATQDKLELITVQLQPARAAAAFSSVKWEKLLSTADSGLMDISPTGTALAYISRGLLGGQSLVTVGTGGIQATTALRGELVHLEWINDSTILYAVQDGRGFTVWRAENGLHRHIARQDGTFLSGHTDANKEQLTFAVEDENDITQLWSVHLLSGKLLAHALISRHFEQLRVVQVTATEHSTSSSIPDITSELEDAELVAFIDAHFAEIVSSEKAPPDGGQAQPERLIVTNRPNTLFVDYKVTGQPAQRLLLTIHDAGLKEWSLQARYEEKGAEWKKVQGAGDADPVPVRLYEWETSLNQWILKSSY